MDERTPDNHTGERAAVDPRVGADAHGAKDMAPVLAHRMSALNTSFYREQAASFSATRHGAWPGWQRCLDALAAGGVLSSPPSDACMSVLDLACGNLRFASFLSSALPDARFDYHAVDNCAYLVEGVSLPPQASVSFHEVDIVGALLDAARSATDSALPSFDGVPACDLAVSFGFLHHVPTHTARLALLRSLLAHTRRGGACCVSLWRFMSDPTLATRAIATTEVASRELGIDPADLGEGDCLLGWQGRPHAFRYCHSFGEGEVDDLVAAVSGEADVIARFSSDGRSGTLNTYLVLRRRDHEK